MSIEQSWQAAQIAERKQHTYSMEEGYSHYEDSYRQYLNYVGSSFYPIGKTIVEIGPADFPALGYCTGYHKGVIIEPMPSELLRNIVASKSGLILNTNPAEEFTLAYSNNTEVWLFNVLQHVKDPHAIVENCKRFAGTIRFFEPINCGTDACHLWNLTMEMFGDWFGKENVNYYPPNELAVNFHTHECAYGVWNKK